MARIRYTATARSDLGEIYRYIRKRSGSGETARRFVHELRNKCEQLAAAPIQMGRTRADLRPDLRSHPDRAYVIFFRYERDVLEIVRMIDSHRDIPRCLTSMSRHSRLRLNGSSAYVTPWCNVVARLLTTTTESLTAPA